MPINVLGGLNPFTPKETGQQKGSVAGKFGAKIGTFFNSVARGVKGVFSAMGKSTSALFSRGANASAASASQSPYTPAEMFAMHMSFKNGDLYQTVQSGTKLDKQLLEDGAEMILKNPQALNRMKECGLRLAEAVSIFIYTTGAYTQINGQLRDGHLSDDVKAVTECCVKGMEKLPSHEGTVTRLVQLPENLLATHVEGETPEYAAFTSTSTNPNGDDNFTGNAFMLIQPKTGSAGKDVSMFSNLPDEQEVLFPPGTQFKILERTEAKERDPYDFLTGADLGYHSNKVNLVMVEV